MSLGFFLNTVSGLGMFLYGMKLLSDSLEQFVSDKIKNKLQDVTGTPLKGVLLGAFVTGIIQSSTATTLMIMGFVNAGKMSIYNALPVIMGANIGTTVTGQLLSLADISHDSVIFSLIKPSGIAPFFVFFGAIEKLFFKHKEHKEGADIFIGLGILFLGMEMMETGIRPLSQNESFCNLLLVFKNPLLSLLAGALMTAVIQSSSVSVGILQTLSTTKAFTLTSAIPIILGMNIGKVLPEFIASLSTCKNTSRLIFADLAVNMCGVFIMFLLLTVTDSVFGKSFANIIATRSMIANFHTLFNIISTVALLPFYKKFILFSKKCIG